ncbi:unnamed protein product, partial [Mesorhabditis spiculigera]
MSTRKVLFNNPAPEEMQVDVHDAAVYVLNGPRRAARKLSVPEYVEEPLFADRAEEAEEEEEEGEVDIVEEKDDFEQIRLERRRTPISSRVTYSSTARRFAPYSIQKRHYGSRYRSYDTGSRDSYQARGWDAWNNGSSNRPYVADPKMSARFKP